MPRSRPEATGVSEPASLSLASASPRGVVDPHLTFKTELIDRSDWTSPAEASAAVFEYIEVFHNRRRRHSSLGNVSPDRFE